MRYINSALLSSAASFAADAAGSAPSEKPVAEKPVAAKPAKAAKPGKPAASKPGKRTAKPAAKPEAATPDARAAKADRIAADRTSVSKLYAAFEANRDSVPVKPLSAFKPKPSHAHTVARNPSVRQAAAIAVAFAAAGKKLATGATVNRVFERDGIRVCIENGCIADAISSGLITVAGDSPETEKLTLRAKPAAIIGLIGERAAKAGGIV